MTVPSAAVTVTATVLLPVFSPVRPATEVEAPASLVVATTAIEAVPKATVTVPPVRTFWPPTVKTLRLALLLSTITLTVKV